MKTHCVCAIFIFIIFFFHLQVDLTRSFTFRNSDKSYTGIPVMAANMDTVGTFNMAREMARVCHILLTLSSSFGVTHDNLFSSFFNCCIYCPSGKFGGKRAATKSRVSRGKSGSALVIFLS